MAYLSEKVLVCPEIKHCNSSELFLINLENFIINQQMRLSRNKEQKAVKVNLSVNSNIKVQNEPVVSNFSYFTSINN
jgi:hypothetical protein